MFPEQLNFFIHLEKISTGRYKALTWKYSDPEKIFSFKLAVFPGFPTKISGKTREIISLNSAIRLSINFVDLEKF